MNCRKVSKNLTAYIDCELPSKTRKEVEEHLQRCRECYARWQELHLLNQELAALPTLEAGDDKTEQRIFAGVRKGIQQEQVNNSDRRMFIPVFEQAQRKLAYTLTIIALVAGLTIGVILGLQVKQNKIEQADNSTDIEDFLVTDYQLDYLTDIREESLAGAYLAATEN